MLGEAALSFVSNSLNYLATCLEDGGLHISLCCCSSGVSSAAPRMHVSTRGEKRTTRCRARSLAPLIGKGFHAFGVIVEVQG